ncbi:MAG: pyridoxal phosphate-dependent aminotransferase [Spirochaetales bacterium]|nr:pyridoxal phosphate-dependent aminotransferase [Spirochaetales bacterium]
MNPIQKSHKLDNVLYDIRGAALVKAMKMEAEGYRILKLHTGNPASFGFNAPEEVVRDMILNMNAAQGYSDSKGIFAARKAVMQYSQEKGVKGVEIDDIWIGNGVSELISIATQGLLDVGDELLIPAPDYPLWTAATTLAGGKPVHYLCDESSDWMPDLADMASKISDRTRGIVIINPNNPTGALYPKEILEKIVDLARQHQLIIFADEIYDKILYDDAVHVSIASLADDVTFLTFNGLSKTYRAAGFRAGWMYLSGAKKAAAGYREGLDLLSNMRMCSNVPGQYGIQTSLGGYQSIHDLTKPGGRLFEQRNLAWSRVNAIPGLSSVKPRGALYLFPKIDVKRFGIHDDQKFIYDFLLAKKVLLVQGRGFNWPHPDHFRIVFLPNLEDLKMAMDALEEFLSDYRQS